MAVNLSSLAGAGQQFFDNDGVPLAGGKLFSFEAGTTTPQTTFTSADGVTQHANPIILDSAGRVPGGQIWISAGLDYKFVLETSDSVLIATWDNITGINGTGVTSDASNVNYTPAGAGAVFTNVQSQFRVTPTQNNYSTNLNFLNAVAANATGKHYVANGANIGRTVDRLFVGGAAAQYGGGPNLPDIGSSWLGNPTDGPAYLASNATFLAYPQECRYGIVGAAKTSLPAGAGSAIAFGAIIINDGALPAWGQIIEAQHETTTDTTWGMEIAIKNASGGVSTFTPFTETGPNRTIGIQLSGGGDNAFGPAATNACSVGIIFATSNGKGFNSGITFRAGSIPTGNAIELPFNYRMAWYDSTGIKSAEISATNNTPSTQMRFNMGSNNFNFLNNAAQSVFYITTTATAVNRIQIAAVDTGNHPQIAADGSDTNIDLRLLPKGTGLIRFGTFSSSADVACNGWVSIKDNAGTTRKLMTTA
jgi:hypothetical protein